MISSRGGIEGILLHERTEQMFGVILSSFWGRQNCTSPNSWNLAGIKVAGCNLSVFWYLDLSVGLSEVNVAIEMTNFCFFSIRKSNKSCNFWCIVLNYFWKVSFITSNYFKFLVLEQIHFSAFPLNKICQGVGVRRASLANEKSYNCLKSCCLYKFSLEMYYLCKE